MNLKILFGSIMVVFLFNGCVATTENLSSLENEDLAPRTPITPRTPNLGLYKESSVVLDKLDNSENPKIPNNISIVNNSGKNFPREKIDTNPLLSKPKIAKIVIESYVDSDGDWHEPSKIHIIIKESSFIEEKKYFSINGK